MLDHQGGVRLVALGLPAPGALALRVAMAGSAMNELELLGRMLSDEGFTVSVLSPDHAAPGPDDADLVIVSVDSDSEDQFSGWWVRNPDVPVAVLIPSGSQADAARLLDEGAAAVWTAPGPRKAVALVRALLRRRRPRLVADAVCAGDVVLDPSTGVLQVGDGFLILEGKRLELAAALLAVPTGSVATHSWLGSRTGLSRGQVEGHVRRLRSSLEAMEGWRRVVSVRGVGYRVSAPPGRPSAAASAPSGESESVDR